MKLQILNYITLMINNKQIRIQLVTVIINQKLLIKIIILDLVSKEI